MLKRFDLSGSLSQEEYRERMPALQERLFDLQLRCWDEKVGVVVVFESWSGAGKGEVIRKVTQRLEPRAFEIQRIRGRRTHELPLPWMYRFWLGIPSYGRFAIFDRSWNRRVLVHGFAGELDRSELNTAYDDIKYFEGALANDRYVVAKYFLHISEREQQERLEALASDEATSWRVRDDDWAQNGRYAEYRDLVQTLLARTESEWAPWTVVAAENLRWARARVLETLIERIEEELPRFEQGVPVGSS